MCSYIHGQRGIFYVHTMQSNSQSGEALNVPTRDIGVPNTLVSDTVGEQTGPQIELQLSH